MKLNLFFSAGLQDSSIKCLNRADFGDRMKYLKISKQSTRSNIYLNLKITDVAFVCQNQPIRFDDLCIVIAVSVSPILCETESKAVIDL